MAPWRDRRGVRARRLVVPRRDDLDDRRLQPLAARHLSVVHIAPVPAAAPDWTAAIWLVGLGAIATTAGIAAFERRDLVGA